MAPAYQNITSGQIVESDEPREDLEALARWKRLADGGIVALPKGATTKAAKVAFLTKPAE